MEHLDGGRYAKQIEGDMNRVIEIILSLIAVGVSVCFAVLLTAIVWMLIFGGDKAEAQEPLTVSVVFVRGEYSLPPVQARAAVRLALSDLSRQTGVQFRLYHWFSVSDIGTTLSAYDDGRAADLYAWRDELDRNGINTPVRLVVAPPMKGAYDVQIMGGMCDKVCRLRDGIALANVGITKRDIRKIRTFFNSVAIIEHEVAHQIGAFHDPVGRTLESPWIIGARAHQDYLLQMTPRSIAEVQACVAKEGM